ncbi:hypothetical protein [Brevibacterium sp. CFH 10365]|uniref:hypothetical protein n=1 Tax=Brevibacterium sp. CFH 10365 TaxID=2585207 RepID=UPI00187A3ADC|nr:hypothetical protein [Brevibacterium sp. CFH 10365]
MSTADDRTNKLLDALAAEKARNTRLKHAVRKLSSWQGIDTIELVEEELLQAGDLT